MTSANTETRETAERRRALPPEARPKRGPEHDQLSVFAGRWQAVGTAHQPGTDAEGHMFADETWEWLPGGFFLTGRFDSHVADTRHKGIGYLAYDRERKTHTCRMIDNLGYDRLYDLAVNGLTWSFRGERERGTYVFSEDRRGIDIRWEYSADGIDWKPLCELKATRTGGLGPTAH